MSVPDEVREDLQSHLWGIADEVGWMTLPASRKTTYYDSWQRDEEIGGVLSRYIDFASVRIYIKDTLMKPYAATRLANPKRALDALGIRRSIEVMSEYEKPHGVLLANGQLICWGKALDWKTVLTAIHERAYGRDSVRELLAVFLLSRGRFQQPFTRHMIEDAASRLGIGQIVWLD